VSRLKKGRPHSFHPFFSTRCWEKGKKGNDDASAAAISPLRRQKKRKSLLLSLGSKGGMAAEATLPPIQLHKGRGLVYRRNRLFLSQHVGREKGFEPYSEGNSLTLFFF